MSSGRAQQGESARAARASGGNGSRSIGTQGAREMTLSFRERSPRSQLRGPFIVSAGTHLRGVDRFSLPPLAGIDSGASTLPEDGRRSSSWRRGTCPPRRTGTSRSCTCPDPLQHSGRRQLTRLCLRSQRSQIDLRLSQVGLDRRDLRRPRPPLLPYKELLAVRPLATGTALRCARSWPFPSSLQASRLRT